MFFKRVVRSGFINFWRTPVISLASVITLSVTLFVIGALILASAFLNVSLEAVKSRVDISVSFKPDAPEEKISELKKSLETLPAVKAVTLSSREQELAEFRERNKDNELILRSLEEVGNPFGARLNIQAADPAHYESIAAFLEEDAVLSAEGESLIDQVSFKKSIIDRLLAFIRTCQKIGLAVTLVLIFISVVVTFNTISLAIYSSREEITIMKLVGAGDHYVRGPFIVEGIMAGFIAALVALSLLYPAVLWLRSESGGVFGSLDLVSYFLNNFAVLFLILAGAGILLGVASSFLAARKHLKI